MSAWYDIYTERSFEPLYLRQARADQNSAPQRDQGTLTEALIDFTEEEKLNADHSSDSAS